MRQRILKTIQFLVFLLLGVVLLYSAFRRAFPGKDVQDVVLRFRDIDYRWIYLSMAAGFLSHFFRACRWRLMGEPLGRTPSLFHVFCAVMTGYLINFVFPRLGEIARCAVLRKTDRMPFEKLIGTVVVERMADMMTVLLMLVCLLLFRAAFFGEVIRTHLWMPLHGMVLDHPMLLAAVLTGLLVVVAAVVAVLVMRDFRERKPVMRLRELLRGVGEGLASVVTMRRRGLFLLFTLLVWGCYLVQMRLSFFALQATSSLTWIDGVFLLVMCSLAVIVPVQGGIGAYHWVITQSLLLYGISNEDGFVFATVSHSAASLLIIGLGFVALLCVALIRNRVTDTGQHA